VAFKWRNLYNYWAEPSKAAQTLYNMIIPKNKRKTFPIEFIKPNLLFRNSSPTDLVLSMSYLDSVGLIVQSSSKIRLH
jgi:hypothetical protein